MFPLPVIYERLDPHHETLVDRYLPKQTLTTPPHSASVATIVRFPYVRTLGNSSDFLYATADIAIWSCSETGLGLTAACCAVLRPLFREVLASNRFINSRVLSRGGTTQTSRGQNSTAWAQESRRGYKRSSSSGWEDEVTLQSLKTHGQLPGKDGKGFGTTTSACYQEDEDVERDLETGIGPLGGEGIVVTTTRNVTST